MERAKAIHPHRPSAGVAIRREAAYLQRRPQRRERRWRWRDSVWARHSPQPDTSTPMKKDRSPHREISISLGMKRGVTSPRGRAFDLRYSPESRSEVSACLLSSRLSV